MRPAKESSPHPDLGPAPVVTAQRDKRASRRDRCRAVDIDAKAFALARNGKDSGVAVGVNVNVRCVPVPRLLAATDGRGMCPTRSGGAREGRDIARVIGKRPMWSGKAPRRERGRALRARAPAVSGSPLERDVSEPSVHPSITNDHGAAV